MMRNLEAGRRKRPATALAGVAALALAAVLAACGSDEPAKDSSAAAPTGKPIKIGAVVSLTGPAVFPEASAGAKAYFDHVNEEGGIQGRPLVYTTVDDGGDPSKAAQAAKTLIDDQDVVALGGGGSLLECAVNAASYDKAGLADIPGTGVDPGCFASAAVSPVNTGPYTGITVSLYYLSEVRGLDPVCYVQQSVPAFNEAFEASVARWTDLTGKELGMPIQYLNPTDDATALVSQLASSDCGAVFLSMTETPLIAFMQAVQAQGLDDSIVLMSQTSGFTDQVAKSLGAAGQGLLANSEFLPYNSDSSDLDEWRDLMKSADVPLTSFAEGGYLAAKIIVDTLKGISGDITRESVSKAFEGVTSYESPLLGSTFSFGPGAAHSSNTASMIVQLEDGAWKPASDDWVRLPE